MSSDSPAAVEPASQTRPRLRLKPKLGGRFFAGAPWVYSNEIVADRRTRALAPGALAVLEDSDRTPLGVVAVNLQSKIVARLLDRNPEAEIDGAWFDRRLGAALNLRERLFDAPYYRLAHAESDGLPGLIIDRYGDAVAIQPNVAWIDRRRTQLLAALERLIAPASIVWNGGSRARALEGLPEEMRLLKGALDAPIETPMNGALYHADLLEGQKTGVYFDQRDNHAYAARLARGGDVLDVFAHVGGFGLAMLAGGAQRATLIDASEAALNHAAASAEAMGRADDLETRRSHAFDALRALKAEGRRFDVVVCDPPAFAPNRSALERGLRGYAKTARLGAALTRPGGVFVLCSCSHAVGVDALRDLAATEFLRARRGAKLLRVGGAGPDHPIHPHLPETGYLKALFFAMD